LAQPKGDVFKNKAMFSESLDHCVENDRGADLFSEPEEENVTTSG
jgi:hypothetical protein